MIQHDDDDDVACLLLLLLLLMTVMMMMLSVTLLCDRDKHRNVIKLTQHLGLPKSKGLQQQQASP